MKDPFIRTSNTLKKELETALNPDKISAQKPDKPEITHVTGGAGIAGLRAGPYGYVMDRCGLGDPLLSKVSINLTKKKNWRIGHFIREIPKGYVDSVKENQNHIKDKSLREYYEKLRLITRGDLFSLPRFITIVKMNLNMYNGLLNSYNHRYDQCQYVDISEVSTYLADVPWFDYHSNIFSEKGLMIALGAARFNTKIQVSFDDNDQYAVHFYQDEKECGVLVVGPNKKKWWYSKL